MVAPNAMVAMLNGVLLVAQVVLLSTTAAQSFIIDLSEVSNTTRGQWCSDQESVCSTLCNGRTSANTCNNATLSYACTCSSGLVPDLALYAGTIATYECLQAYADCMIVSKGNIPGEQQCNSTILTQCGTKESSNFASSSLGLPSFTASSLTVASSPEPSSMLSATTTTTLASASGTVAGAGSPTETQSSSPSPTSAPQSDYLSVGAKAGIGVGAGIALILALLGLYYLCRTSYGKASSDDAESGSDPKNPVGVEITDLGGPGNGHTTPSQAQSTNGSHVVLMNDHSAYLTPDLDPRWHPDHSEVDSTGRSGLGVMYGEIPNSDYFGHAEVQYTAAAEDPTAAALDPAHVYISDEHAHSRSAVHHLPSSYDEPATSMSHETPPTIPITIDPSAAVELPLHELFGAPLRPTPPETLTPSTVDFPSSIDARQKTVPGASYFTEHFNASPMTPVAYDLSLPFHPAFPSDALAPEESSSSPPPSASGSQALAPKRLPSNTSSKGVSPVSTAGGDPAGLQPCSPQSVEPGSAYRSRGWTFGSEFHDLSLPPPPLPGSGGGAGGTAAGAAAAVVVPERKPGSGSSKLRHVQSFPDIDESTAEDPPGPAPSPGSLAAALGGGGGSRKEARSGYSIRRLNMIRRKPVGSGSSTPADGGSSGGGGSSGVGG